MGYVKTAEEVRKTEDLFAAPRFLFEGVRATFTTEPDFVASVLPPGLDPAGEPEGYISIGRWQSAVCGEFDTGSIFLKAKRGDIVGWYNLTMIVSGEMPVTWGREVWGEVKKHGKIGVHKDGDLFYAYVERDGVRLMEIDARLTDRQENVVVDSVGLEVKAMPSMTGRGLEFDPLLVHLECRSTWSHVIGGTGTVSLKSTRNDPVGTIPIVSVDTVSFAEGETAYTVHEPSRLCGKEEYLPYFYGRNYDDFLSFPIAARYR